MLVGEYWLTSGVKLIVIKLLSFQPTYGRHQFGAKVIFPVEEEAWEMSCAFETFHDVTLARLHTGCWVNHDEVLRFAGVAMEDRGWRNVPSSLLPRSAGACLFD